MLPTAALAEAVTARPTHIDGRYIGSVDPNYVPRFRVTVKDRDGDRVLYSAQPKQDELHACQAPNIWFGGAAGGGKSHAARWHGYINCLRRSGIKVLLLRRQFKELETTHILEIPKELPSSLASYHTTLHRLTFRKTGSMLQFGHAHSLKDVRSYLSTAWDLIIVDEASEFTPQMLSLLQSRLRTKLEGIRPQFILVSNPGGEAHLWLVQRFISREVDPKEDGKYNPANYEFIQSLVGDNAYNDEFYLDRLLSLGESDREAFLYGNMDAFAGQYFREWKRSIHVIESSTAETPEELGVEDWWEVQAGMDWGYDPSPGIVLWSAFDPFGRGIVYKEYKFELTAPREVAENIVARCTTEAERNMTIIGDSQMRVKDPSAGGVSIMEQMNEVFADLGTGINIQPANKDRINGWMRVHTFLDVRRPDPAGSGSRGPFLRVMEGNTETGYGAPYLISTIGAQVHSDKQDGDMKKQGNDHAADTLRYLLMAREPLSIIPRELIPFKGHRDRLNARTRKLMEIARKRRHSERQALESAIPEERLPGLDNTEDDELDDGVTVEGMDDMWN